MFICIARNDKGRRCQSQTPRRFMLCKQHFDDMELADLLDNGDYQDYSDDEDYEKKEKKGGGNVNTNHVKWSEVSQKLVFRTDEPICWMLRSKKMKESEVPTKSGDSEHNLNDPQYRLKFFQNGRLLPFVLSTFSPSNVPLIFASRSREHLPLDPLLLH